MSKTDFPFPAGHRPLRARVAACTTAGALLLGAILAAPALAIDNGGPLDQAIAAGTIGEQADGYLGFVQPATPAQRELERRVREVNLGRRSVYAEVATRNGETQDRVAVLQAVRQITNTEAGSYFRDLSGTWCRRAPVNKVGFASDGTIQIQCR
jgi:uncharacterized protein